jgi:putative aldouronate transport system permease protein
VSELLSSSNVLRKRWRQTVWRHLLRDKYLILLIIPVITYYIVFCYYPMYGVIIAFKDYRPGLGIMASKWVGLENFTQFFGSFYFSRLMTNTLAISTFSLLWGFPLPIILALMLNEFKDGLFKRGIQTVSYFPHFVSLVVTCGMIINFFSPSGGFVNDLIRAAGGKPINFLGKPQYFRTIYVASGIWQGLGWSSIIYIAALTGIDPQLYEAARIDGAGRWAQVFHVSLPSIIVTIIILLILNVGNIMSVGYEKIILLYSPSTYETADVISTYVYRQGLQSSQYSFSAAVGFFNSVINLTLLVVTNQIARRTTGQGIW